VIAAVGQRERPQRLDLDDAAGPALAGRGVGQPLQQRERRPGSFGRAWCSSLMTVAPAMLKAANRLLMPWRR
jgi:hypothetical protein